jgi:phosphatidylinositol-3,4,5-trisphosphate 3-phosphatase/dual-specificity protein phosphatase PTEN
MMPNGYIYRRSEKRYANDVFDNTAEFIFKDHHAPTLSTVIEFCEDASHYLLQHPLNVVVVHCKAGKGRTGLMISALLLKLQVANDPMEAMQIYADRRTHDGSGITIPSQRRYVFYYDTFLHKSGRVEDRTIEIKKIVLIGRQNAMGQNGNTNCG